MCERAWSLFQAIEAEGGIEASLRAGAIQARIAEAARPRAEAIATLNAGIVGTSRFPNLHAPAPAVLDVRPAPAPPASLAGALPSTRDAAPFEALRDRADAIAAEHGRPRLFLATLGAPAAFGARATYAATFFAAAGIEAAPPLREETSEERLARFAEAETTAVCLCGDDKTCADQAAPAAKALRRGRRAPCAARGATRRARGRLPRGGRRWLHPRWLQRAGDPRRGAGSHGPGARTLARPAPRTPCVRESTCLSPRADTPGNVGGEKDKLRCLAGCGSV